MNVKVGDKINLYQAKGYKVCKIICNNIISIKKNEGGSYKYTIIANCTYTRYGRKITETISIWTSDFKYFISWHLWPEGLYTRDKEYEYKKALDKIDKRISNLQKSRNELRKFFYLG